MTDLDRYITEEAVQAAARHTGYSDRYDVDGSSLITEVLRAALPTILTQHRIDVLREVASWFDPMGEVARMLEDAIDEAVAGE